MKTNIKILSIVIFFLFSFSELTACDTWIALKKATKSGRIIFGKNSDRLQMESQPLFFYPAKDWANNELINTGRLKIPQVKRTYAVLGSSPYWCWGFEQGINEHGLVIGNEGVQTKGLAKNLSIYQSRDKFGLCGMDYIRFALERAKTAEEAIEVITSLLQEYGQFAPALIKFGMKGAYDNTYLIADPNEAWILETSSKQWIAKKITGDYASISNKLSIENKYDKSSANLINHASNNKWYNKSTEKTFSFCDVYADNSQIGAIRKQRAAIRQNCSYNLLKQNSGNIDFNVMQKIARDGSTNPSIDLDVTASSCIAELPLNKNELPVFWWCASVPSNSCFVPFFVHGSKLPLMLSQAGKAGRILKAPELVAIDEYKTDSYWWMFRKLSDLVNADRLNRHSVLRKEFDLLEKEFRLKLPEIQKEALRLRKAGKINEMQFLLDQFTENCIKKVLAKSNELITEFESLIVEVPGEYKNYIGKYSMKQGAHELIFIIKMTNGNLSLEIPGRGVFELNATSEKDKFYFAVNEIIKISFIWEEEDVSKLIFDDSRTVLNLTKL